MPAESAPTTISVNVFRADSKVSLAMELTFQLDPENQNDYFHFDKIQVHSRELEDGETDEDFYHGPNFNSLDPVLQEGLSKYLGDLGIDSELCKFIENYAVIKEQKEYE